LTPTEKHNKEVNAKEKVGEIIPLLALDRRFPMKLYWNRLS
jgi:hypothetical protein